MAHSPLFVKTYDLLNWLIPHTLKFPREQRAVLARRLQDAAFGLHYELVSAARSDSLHALVQADIQLTLLRTYLRLAKEWRLLSIRQYEHASHRVDEIGRLLGAWRKRCENGANPLQP
ncbi:MAG: diversity-generating retroelement protein Avd [Candidatus Competibacteraceae bacterium]|nr:diversity-generating retroelement protein Avd [Candidatus Competibacteraceae bacterium]MCB1815910.1 diversity-generating retroelement protein Avd [Candidatus Competibacteraceae bacterium]